MRVNCDDNGDFAASGEFFFAARERWCSQTTGRKRLQQDLE
jgi:hypothetical protein